MAEKLVAHGDAGLSEHLHIAQEGQLAGAHQTPKGREHRAQCHSVLHSHWGQNIARVSLHHKAIESFTWYDAVFL